MAHINLRAIRFLLLACTCVVAVTGRADEIKNRSDLCGDVKGLGWNFYCEEAKRKPVAPEPPPAPAPAPSAVVPEPTDLDRVKDLGKQVEQARAAAMLDPTNKAKMARAIELELQALTMASDYADARRRLQWQHPELDYTTQRPVNTLGKTLWLDDRKESEKKAVADLADRYGVFFIFAGSCGPCHVYSPVLRAWADENNVTVFPVSLDGGVLPEWPSSVMDNGTVAKMGLASYPTPMTVLFDKQTREVMPVGFGILSHDVLRERIYVLTKLEIGDDY